MAKGYSQNEGIDFNEVFAPIVKQCSIRILLCLVTKYNLELHQLDVKTACLNGDLEENIIMFQPEGFELGDPLKRVCLLKRSLYGLKQSPRQWNKKFDMCMMKIGFIRSISMTGVYIWKRARLATLYTCYFMWMTCYLLQRVSRI